MIDCPALRDAVPLTFARRKENRDTEVVDTPISHWTVSQKMGGQRKSDEESMGLEQDLLAGCSHITGAKKHDAGLIEETDKMIQEAVQSCYSIEKRKENIILQNENPLPSLVKRQNIVRLESHIVRTSGIIKGAYRARPIFRIKGSKSGSLPLGFKGIDSVR